MSVRTELLYSLVSADSSVLYAQAETLDAILLAAATIREEGETGELIVERGGEYDAAATLLAQEGMAV